MLLSGLGCRLGFDLKSEIDEKKEIGGFMESMLSPAGEHGFGRSEDQIFSRFRWFEMVFEGL